MIEILILAIALSMDAVAVSIALGARYSNFNVFVAVKIGFFFGLAQAIMPIIGYMLGQYFIEWIERYGHWIASFILIVLGLKMLYEAYMNTLSNEELAITSLALFGLAVATSIDAMAAGLTFNEFKITLLQAIGIIGTTTFILSAVGNFIGTKSTQIVNTHLDSASEDILEKGAEYFGGLILIAIGLKIILSAI